MAYKNQKKNKQHSAELRKANRKAKKQKKANKLKIMLAKQPTMEELERILFRH